MKTNYMQMIDKEARKEFKAMEKFNAKLNDKPKGSYCPKANGQCWNYLTKNKKKKEEQD